MQLPIAIVADGAILSVHRTPTAFLGPDGTLHPQNAVELYTPDDWMAFCPGWTPLPLFDEPPEVTGKRAERRPVEAWTVTADAVTVTYDLIDLDAAEIAASVALLEARTVMERAEAVQLHLDLTAKRHGYDSIATLVTYAEEPAVEKFQLEGRAARAWRSAVWARCYELLDEVKSGTRAPLTDEELLDELPELDWPTSPAPA